MCRSAPIRTGKSSFGDCCDTISPQTYFKNGFIRRSLDEGGPKGTRTPDLPHAMGTRYQLRYRPLMLYILTNFPKKYFVNINYMTPTEIETKINQIESRNRKVELDKLLTSSDIICLCANLTEESYHMISKNEIEKMKDGVYISNSARGALLDENAVAWGLKSGKIAGFATDVLEEEPGRKDHPYLAFDNVIMTPHTSAYTMECLEQMGEKCVTDIEQIIQGQLPERAVQDQSDFLVFS